MANDQFSLDMGLHIAEIRRSHNVTQEALSEMLDVSPKHISHTECGTSTLSLKNHVQFCEIFHCSLDYVVMGKTTDDALRQIPGEVIQIFYSEDEKELDRLNRYLQIYVELVSQAKS